jgi:hypothetical protein
LLGVEGLEPGAKPHGASCSMAFSMSSAVVMSGFIAFAWDTEKVGLPGKRRFCDAFSLTRTPIKMQQRRPDRGRSRGKRPIASPQ